MRIFRGLENIHAVIDRHETEWLRDQGEEPTERHPRISLEETVRRRLTEQPGEGSGKFSADRFLGGKTEAVKREAVKPEPEIMPEITPEDSESDSRHSWLYNEVMKAVNKASGSRKDAKVIAVFVPVIQNTGTAKDIPADEAETFPEDSENAQAVEIIRNKDGKHSRLYDEVMKAVNDSAGDSRKIVAVFVPLVQNGKEFEDLPADETVTLPPVSEDAVKIETPPENEPEISAPEVIPAFIEAETADTPEIEPETEPELSADFDLIPEMSEPDPVVIEALQEMEEKLETDNESEAVTSESESVPETSEAETLTEIPADESVPETLPDEQEPEIIPEPVPDIMPDEQEPEIITDESETVTETAEPEAENDSEDDDDILQDGEPMVYENLDAVGQEDSAQEEITLPAELDDDEVVVDGGEFDESLTEIHTADEDDSVIIETDGDISLDDEIELLPDTEKH